MSAVTAAAVTSREAMERCSSNSFPEARANLVRVLLLLIRR
jgi:hypothetical protein